MVEARRDIFGDRGLLHHMRPIEQKVVVIEHVLMLLDLDITCEKGLQLCVPHLAPGKIKIQNLLERLLAVDRARIDSEAGALGRKTLVRFREAEIVPDEIHQVRRVLAIMDRESGRKPDCFGIFA